MSKIGDRVGAISDMNKERARIYGYGVYAGNEIPPEDAGGFNLGIPNPKIQLDSGKSVFGCECWWGSEEKMRKMIGDREVVIVDIDAERDENQELLIDGN